MNKAVHLDMGYDKGIKTSHHGLNVVGDRRATYS